MYRDAMRIKQSATRSGLLQRRNTVHLSCGKAVAKAVAKESAPARSGSYLLLVYESACRRRSLGESLPTLSHRRRVESELMTHKHTVLGSPLESRTSRSYGATAPELRLPLGELGPNRLNRSLSGTCGLVALKLNPVCVAPKRTSIQIL